MNKDLKNDIYSLPDGLVEKLTSIFTNLKPKQKGYERCKNLVDNPKLTHSQAKKFKHELENDLEDTDYDVVGGDDRLDFINNSLEGRRDIVHHSKKIRQNAGQENVFKKTHTKDKTKNPTKVRKIKISSKSDDINNNRAIYEEIDRIKQLLK